MRNWNKRALLSLVVFSALGLGGVSSAQNLGDGPIRLIVPYPAGGGGDIMARGIAPGLGEALGRTVIIENITGATGSVGLTRATKGTPDGTTLVYVTAINTANVATRPEANVSLDRDLAAVGMIAQSAFVLTVSPEIHVNTVQELIALGKSRPGGLRFGSAGPGSNHHFLAEMFKSATGIPMTHIPYRGEAGAIPDLIAGRVDFMFLTASVAPYLKSKRLIGLGITSGDVWPSLPDLQPLSKQGLPTMAYNGWNGLMAPKNTPPAVITKLNAALASAIKSEVAERTFALSGFKPVGGPPEALERQVAADMKLFKQIIEEQHLTFGK